MNKQYVAPKSTVYNYIQPLTPLCASNKEFGVGSSDAPKGGTTSSIWSNGLEKPTQGGMWSHMDD